MSYSQQQITNACQQLYVGKVFHQHNVAFKIEGFSPVSGKVSVKNLNTEEYSEINCWDIPEIATAFFADDNVQKNNAYYRNNHIENNHSFGLSLSSYDIDFWKNKFPYILKDCSIDEIKKYLSKLDELDLFNDDDISRLPESFGQLHNLKELHISSINLSTLPTSILQLKNLKKLDLSCYNLTALPVNIGELHNLQELDVSCCTKLATLPQSIGRLKQLTTLKLSSCHRLIRLPESIGELSKLRTLDLYGCEELWELPESIGQLHNLQELNVRDCKKLERIPNNLLPNCKIEQDNVLFHIVRKIDSFF